MKYLSLLLLLLYVLVLEAGEFHAGQITVSYSSGDARIAGILGERLARNVSDFHKMMGVYPEMETKVVIAADKEDFLSYARTSGGIIEFSEAFYQRRTNTIYIRNPRDELNFMRLNQILLHEYIHHFIFYHFRDAPLWFHEGMAVFFSDDLGIDREMNLVWNSFLGNTRRLNEMGSSYPEKRIEWESFYSKSALAVRYLYHKESDGFYELWQRAKPWGRFESAFLHSFHFTEQEYAEEFESYSRSYLGSLIFMESGKLIWLFAVVLLLAGILRYIMRSRRKYKELEEEESVEEVEYNYIVVKEEEEN